MARNRQRVESQSDSGEESGSDTDQRTPTPNVANPDESSSSSQEDSGSGSYRNGSMRSGSRSDAGPAVAKAREDGERKADATAKKSSDDSKKLLFQRIWSEDDEIAILNGITEYSSEKKSDPMADLDAFHGFIKKNLQVDVTRTQLQHKIRRLKKKYQNNTNKAKDGKARKFSKSHEQKAYDLSKTVWGNEVGKIKGGENRMGNNLSTLIECENSILGKRSRDLGMAERILRAGAELFEGGEGVKGEKEWKKLKRDEVELYCKELELKLAQSRLVLDVLKPNDL